jgi:hypothetical protein
MTTTLLAGFFALAGALGAQLVSAIAAKRSHDRTTAVTDGRRWLVDRRTVYAQYLALASQMYRNALGIRGSSHFVGVWSCPTSCRVGD